ncbi:Thiamine-monophosphate kinase [Methyloligella halotolerans]|uniref:Thiamine-monophosphate kinase n=1 Tax=Methyloligella halotolerans TaxID=1177755 RepID=A0A1E2S2A8_9HYPH|nr:thiamine-phosphate kinase [Methyloligella halotolerans]ODA68571.1 Thiamine-monophosphate kinase [Methyloligella halotolerans]
MATPPDRDRLGEFDIIARFFAPLATDPASLGLTDDAALLHGEAGKDLAVTTDTLIEGVHFLSSDPAETIGHKVLAVNLSDLASMGAEPMAYLLALSLPEHDPAFRSADWLGSFAAGLQQLQEASGATLIGGDTTGTPGPLAITITAMGRVPEGQAVLRSRAREGDLLYVTGTIGDAALGLRLLKDPSLSGDWNLTDDETRFLIDRYRRPQPRTGLARVLRHHANAAIDLSDGLAGDADKLCIASGLGARVDGRRVPLSKAAAKACKSDPSLLPALLGGGDDYEILAAIPEDRARAFEIDSQRPGVPVTAIGSLHARLPTQAEFIGLDGEPISLERRSFSHF